MDLFRNENEDNHLHPTISTTFEYQILWNHCITIYPFLSSYERSIYSSLHFKILLCHHTLHLCRDGSRRDDIMPRSTSPYVYMALVESKTFFPSTFVLFLVLYLYSQKRFRTRYSTHVQKDNVMGFSKLIWDVSEIILVLRAPEISFVFHTCHSMSSLFAFLTWN